MNPGELESLILLNRLLLSSRQSAWTLLEQGHAASHIVAMIEEENLFNKAEPLKKIRLSFNAASEIEACLTRGDSVIPIVDGAYPVWLKTITDPPLILYCRGRIESADISSVAVVGTRHPSFYGMSQAKRFCSDLARMGMSIVSGFARGIDAIAHESAMGVRYGRTIAVLGCGLDVDYPKEHRKLRDQIVERGALVTEYALGTPPRAENFPRRNRIIAGLSLGVLVVEAHSRSGSLITAHQAVEQGKDVFAIPGPVDQLTSRGTHFLIKEGAALVEDAAEILNHLSIAIKTVLPPKPTQLLEVSEIFPVSGDRDNLNLQIKQDEAGEVRTEVESELPEVQVLGYLADGPKSYDQILNRFHVSTAQAAFVLMKLQLSGKIRKEPGGAFARGKI